MVNAKKLEVVKKIILIVSCVGLLVIGLVLGSSLSQKKTEKTKPKETTEAVKEDTKTLTTKEVEDFLIAYYTKKDVGENRNRYEPLVTTYLFNDLVEQEEQPVNQAYKGYNVNQVFDQADIYVDTTHSTAIAFITYKYTQRAHKGTDEGALLNQTEQEAIKLTFLKQGKKFLVNKTGYVSLTEPLEGGFNNYKLDIEVPTPDSTESKEITEGTTTKTEETTMTTTETEEKANE